MSKFTTVFILSLFAAINFWSSEYNILDFGATRDFSTISTKAINDAVEKCYRNGGGRVIIPAGKFKSGTVILKDNVDLYLENGAYLVASEENEDFPILPRTAYRSLKDAGGWVSFIFAENAANISISGKGTIDGMGEGRKGSIPGFGGDLDGLPRNILFISCQNVSVSGVTMRNSAMWNQHYLDCEDVVVNDIRVYNHANGNNDGIDIDGCRRFILSNSIIDSDDDGIVLKSTGLAPCEDIIINNCIVSSFANAIKYGTESTGGFKNISISNCIIKPSRHKGERIIKSTPTGITAISLEIVDGGTMDGVSIDNILIEGTECPLYIRLANRGRKHIEEVPIPLIGKMRNIRISNVTAYNTGNFGSSITGIPERRIENISLTNVRFINKGGLKEGMHRNVGTEEEKRHDVGADMYFNEYLASFRNVIEDEKGYPQPTVWRNLPSYGLFIRNVNRIEVDNATFSSDGSEPRVPIIAVNVGYLQLDRINAQSQSISDIILNRIEKFEISDKLKVKIVK